MGATLPIADGLFTWPGDEPHLIGGRGGAGPPRVGYAQIYGAPRTAGVSIVSR